MSDSTLQEWPLRPWLLAALLGVAALLIYHIGGGQGPGNGRCPPLLFRDAT